MPEQRRLVTPPPVEMNGERIASVGTLLFFVAFLGLLPFWGWLGSHDHRIWLWTALAGTLVGLFGWTLLRRHRAMGRTL